MGCAQSSNLPREDGNAPSNAPAKSAGTPEAKVDDKEVKVQRRRLSVAPQHVGDITKAQQAQLAAMQRGSISDAKALGGLSQVEIESKGNMQHAVLSRKGYVPYNKNKVNQDRFVLRYALQEDPQLALFGVMDGHGEFGHLVAAFVEENLPKCLALETKLKTEPEASITAAVKRMCTQLAQTEINATFSGSTLVFGVKVADTLYVANVGDSRCLLINQKEDGSIQPIPLSIDQKPELPAEKARIERAGGRVEPLPGPPGECGPPRVWLAEADVPGLAMSRSIGDEVSQTVGVISVPEIISHKIEGNDIFVMWASDGVWEFLSNEQVGDIVWKHRTNLVEAVGNLVDASSACWKKEEEVVDDITCVLLQLNPPK